MPDLRQTRKEIKMALAVMAAIDVIALAFYLSPLVGSAESRRMDINRLRAEVTTKRKQVEPLQNLDEKIKVANQQIADFYKKRIPTQNSVIATELGKLAAANGVSIETANYKAGDLIEGRLQRVEVEADFAGHYEALARFINSLERDDTFFIINSVGLGGEQQGPVKLKVKLETYLRAGA
jgi:Tfp pilus assembly protein PilO